MKFLLTKASDWDFDGKGIKKKFNPRIEKYDIYDIRTLASADLYNAKFTDNWFHKGVDHTEIKIGRQKCIQRRFPNDCEGVFIDINSLEDLIDFENTYGKIIISQAICIEFIKEIKIYDDYIE